MRLFLFVCSIIIFQSCNVAPKGNLNIHGTIEGLRKGTVYLYQYKDTNYVAIDSVTLYQKEDFSFTRNISQNELLFVALDHNMSDRASLFAEPGDFEIKATLGALFSAKVTGMKNQELLNEYVKMTQRFQDQRLDIIQSSLLKKETKNTIDSLQIKTKKSWRRQYLFATNYAMTHKDYDVAPYIALAELTNANRKLLDTINNSLSPAIKKSYYGQLLEELLHPKKK